MPEDVKPVLMAWSPDSSLLAFHYYQHSADYDYHMPRFGICVVDLEGKIRKISTPQLVDGRCGEYLYAVPHWSPNGKALYFAAAPDEGTVPIPHWPTPALYCYRYDLETSVKTLLSPGIPCGLSSDEAFLLLRDCPSDNVVTDDAGKSKREPETWKLDLRTGEKSVLPSSIRFPKLSPSGLYVALQRRSPEPRELKHFIDFHRTSDWERVTSVEIPGPIMDLSRWGTQAAWIARP